MLCNVSTNVKGKQQGEADESQPPTQTKRKPGSLPVPHAVVNRARLHLPKLQSVETDVDCSPPVSSVDFEMACTGFTHHIVGPRMRPSSKKPGGDPLAKRLQKRLGG